MELLMLCGYFAPQYRPWVAGHTKTWVEDAANLFQHRLLEGLAACGAAPTVVSAPFIAPWPTGSTALRFDGFGDADTAVEYLPFHNLWGWRNLSRAAALKAAAGRFAARTAGPRAVLVYAAHTPFLEAAVHLKRLAPNTHIHLIVPDLPQYMDLSGQVRPVYRAFKAVDQARFARLNRQVDSYTLLTPQMAQALSVGARPYTVAEAITDPLPPPASHPRGRAIGYAGKLTEAFGVGRLLAAFALLNDPAARLHICGAGPLAGAVQAAAQKDSRIRWHGQLPAEQAAALQAECDVLVNPRCPGAAYTQYSFPSKNVAYLATGNTVVAHLLAGMPPAYRKFLVQPAGTTPAALTDALRRALHEPDAARQARAEKARAYLAEHCEKSRVAGRILTLVEGS